MLLTPFMIIVSLVCTDVRIDQVLPDTTIVVLSVKNVETLGNHLQKSGLCDSFHEIGQLLTEEADFELCPFTGEGQSELLASLGIEDGEFPEIPSGHAGWGLYPVADYETGSVGLGMLALVELGDSTWGDLLDRMIKETASQHMQVEEIDLAGHSVWMISGFIPDDLPTQAMGLDPNSFDSMYVVISDGYLVVGTEPDGIANTLAAIDGEPEENRLESSDVFNGLMNRCGRDGDAFGAVLLTNLADTIVQMDSSGMSMMYLPMLKTTFGDMDGIAESIKLMTSDDVMLEGTYALLMGDGRNGLAGLIGTDAPRASVPAFLSEDTISYSQVQLDLDKLVPLIQEILSSNPMVGQVVPNMEQFETMIAQAIAPLGSQCHFISTGHLPISSDSLGYLAAIECTDEKAFSTFLSSKLPSLGATPGDFLGNQIFTIDFGGGSMLPMDMSISIAVNGGYAFLGTTHSVENALRKFANPSESNKREVDGSRNQAASGWGFGNPRKSMEIQSAMMDQMSQDMFTVMEEFDAEMAAEMRKEFEQSQMLQKAILDSFSSFLGPMVWELHADDTGFTSTVVLHRAEE